MQEHTEATGTDTSETAGDEVKETSAEPVEASSGGAAEGPSTQQLLDELNALRAELANVSTRQTADATPPTAEQPTYEDQLRQELAEIHSQGASLDAEIEVLATRGNDPVAKQLLQQKRMLQTSLKATAWGLQKMQEQLFESSMPESDRDDFRKFKNANRNRFADLEACFDAFEGQRARNQRAVVDKTKRRAEQIIADRGRGVVSTGTREVPAAEMRERKGPPQMTETAFDTKVAQLQAEGRYEEARALMRDANSGKLDLTK